MELANIDFLSRTRAGGIAIKNEFCHIQISTDDKDQFEQDAEDFLEGRTDEMHIPCCFIHITSESIKQGVVTIKWKLFHPELDGREVIRRILNSGLLNADEATAFLKFEKVLGAVGKMTLPDLKEILPHGPYADIWHFLLKAIPLEEDDGGLEPIWYQIKQDEELVRDWQNLDLASNGWLTSKELAKCLKDGVDDALSFMFKPDDTFDKESEDACHLYARLVADYAKGKQRYV